MNENANQNWLLVDIDGEDIHFGVCEPSASPTITHVKSYQTMDFPTATDCFMFYSNAIGVPLKNVQCGVSVTGAVGLDSVRLQRCRWVFSITGLSYLLGSRPFVINDSQLKSWTSLASDPRNNIKIGGIGGADFSAPGKWLTLNYAHGLGASLLRREDRERIYAIDSECGHIGFAPQDALEEKLLHCLLKSQPRVSYEHILFLERTSDALQKADINMSTNEYDKMRAGVLGSFAGDMVISFLSWSGVFLHIGSKQLLDNPEMVSIFNTRFEAKGNFKSTLLAVPRFLVPNQHNNLQGVARMMAMQNNLN
jgi:glucokinase